MLLQVHGVSMLTIAWGKYPGRHLVWNLSVIRNRQMTDRKQTCLEYLKELERLVPNIFYIMAWIGRSINNRNLARSSKTHRKTAGRRQHHRPCIERWGERTHLELNTSTLTKKSYVFALLCAAKRVILAFPLIMNVHSGCVGCHYCNRHPSVTTKMY